MSNNQGIDYFSLDVSIFSDAKIIKLIKRYGPLGFMSYLIMIVHIYQKGYYLELSIDDLAQIILSKVGGKYVSGPYKLQEIILYLASIDLIDSKLLEQGIITSEGIQKRFVQATKKRKLPDYSKYWLLEPTDIKDIKEEVKEDDDYSHLPEKEQKRIKVKEEKRKQLEEEAPNKHYLTSCLITYRYIDEYDLNIHKYNELFKELHQNYDKELLYDAVKYLCNYASKKTAAISDKYYFFEKSIKENLHDLTNKGKLANMSIEDMFKELIKK